MTKKALIVNPYWDTLGGGERYTATLIRLLLHHGWQVDLDWADDTLSAKIMARFGLDISACRLVSDTNTEEYDLAFWVSDGSVPTSFAKKTIIHLQFPFHGIGGGSPLNFIKSRFYTFVVNSRFTKSFIDSEYHVNSRVIYPPVATADFKPGKKENMILYVGRFSHLTQAKGQEILVSAFKHITQNLPGWHLVLAGGTSVGTHPQDMENLKKSLAGFPIRLVADPAFTALKNLYSKAAIFWSAAGFGVDETTDPTRVEHFGITVVEAMAAGAVPVITQKGGFREIVSPGVDGFLWSDPADLEHTTVSLVGDPPRLQQMSRAAVAKSKIFDMERFDADFSRLIGL
jgi:glycosyltransferase involved in cell wall biosynthesis